MIDATSDSHDGNREMPMRRSLLRFSLLLVSLLSVGCVLPNGTRLADGPKDSVVSAEVEAKLAEDRLENLSGIIVTSERGTITLTGTVHKAEQKARAAELARQVTGVRRVKNDLEIQATIPP
ncbi:MAG: hypothetical protein OJF47_003642 [Nitrospira sp.]|jgi:hypothetical protein|nr:MAG: hypothetical protein OJF47_003642 [Nitrospira sp.]